jgi:hypothetical protein
LLLALYPTGLVSHLELLNIISSTRQQQQQQLGKVTGGTEEGSYSSSSSRPPPHSLEHAGSDASNSNDGTLMTDTEDTGQGHGGYSAEAAAAVQARPYPGSTHQLQQVQLLTLLSEEQGGQGTALGHKVLDHYMHVGNAAEGLVEEAADKGIGGTMTQCQSDESSAGSWWASDPKLVRVVQQLIQSPAGATAGATGGAVAAVAAVGAAGATLSGTRSSILLSSSNRDGSKPSAGGGVMFKSQTHQMYCRLLQQELAIQQMQTLSPGLKGSAGCVDAGLQDNASTAAVGGAATASRQHVAPDPEKLHVQWVSELLSRPLNERFQQLECEALVLSLQYKKKQG